MENTDGQKTYNYENKIQPENIMDPPEKQNKTTKQQKKPQKLRLEYENPNKNKEGYAEGIITSAGSKTPDHLTDDSRSSTNYMLYQKWIFFGGFGADSSNSGLKCN